jgi:ribosomal protein eL43
MPNEVWLGFGMHEHFKTFLNPSLFRIGMAEALRGLGPVKRYGTRYGRTTKNKAAKIEIEMKKDHKCPYCAKPKVHRVSFGIWLCEKCNAKFTAKAYTVGSKLSLVEQAAQMIAEAPVLREREIVEDNEQ